MKEVEKITSEGDCIAYFNDRKDILVGYSPRTFSA